MKRKYILVLVAACTFSLSAMAQQTITGVVKNQQNSPVLGAAIIVVGNSAEKAITDENGVFSINAEKGNYIEIVYAGNKRKRIWVTDDSMDIVLSDWDSQVENRGTYQTDISRTQAISSISGEELHKNSTTNLSNALYGLIPGLMVTQHTGWSSNAELMVRGGGSLSGSNPLIVVDGIPRNIENLNLEEVENVSVLKDGAATALWGTRGANGVVMITTKRGQYQNRDIDINYTYGIGIPVNQPEFVDGYTYALMKNEALYYDGLPLEYDKAALEAFRTGSNRDLFSNTNWAGKALRNHTVNNQLNIALRGGGKKLRYYTAINYKNDYGILNSNLVDNERYNAQMKKYDLNARMNIDVDITPYTKVGLNLFGLMRQENRPNTEETQIFSTLYHVPAAAFPVRTSSGAWGGDYMFKKNPIAQIADVGYYKTDRRMLQADMRIYQDLSLLTRGLKAEFGVSYDNDAVYRETGSKNYAYEVSIPVFVPVNGEYDARHVIYGDNSALSVNNDGLASQFMTLVIDGKLGYDRAFGRHAVNGTLQYRQESYTPMGRNAARKRQAYIFTAGYGYDNKYLIDVVVNRNGTSVLSDGNKFRTYPAVSAAWVLSNEHFMKNTPFDLVKVRASWGRSGRDNIDYDLDERYWISGGGFLVGGGLGEDNKPGHPSYPVGLIPGALPITDLTIELADKYNVGIDMQMFKQRLSLTVDFFYDKRKDMLIDAKNMFSSAIGTGIPKQNIGRMNSKGTDLSLMWKDNMCKNFNYYVGATFSYLKSEIEENGEGYQPYGYLYHKGDAYYQNYGLEAIGYFRDEQDIKNSPKQMFSDVRPGDIKYKDQNNDGRIDDYDVVKIGYSSKVPQMYYGINLGVEYKGFGVDAFFQGIGKISKMLNIQSVYWPLRNGNSNLSTWYLKDNIHWTEETKDIANLPRLTTQNNANNFRSSTQWLKNGSYFKLRNLNVYYNLPQKWANAMKMDKCQIYVRGNNLFSLDHIKYLNCEDFSLGYPDLASVYFGVNVNF